MRRGWIEEDVEVKCKNGRKNENVVDENRRKMRSGIE
jgi:hypothetical protein